MPKSKTKPLLIILPALAISFVAFGAFSLLQEIRRESGRFVAQKQTAAALDSKIKSLEDFGGRYQKLIPDLKKTDALFVSAELPVDFIRFLEKISSEAGLNIKISPSAPIKTGKDPWSSSLFQIVGTGSFPSLLRFIDKLQNGQYLVEMQDMNVLRLSQAELQSKEFSGLSLGAVRAAFSLKVFVK